MLNVLFKNKISAAFILGLGAAPLYTIQGCLVTDLANEYAAHTKEKIEACISKFFGIFMVIYQSRKKNFFEILYF